MKRQFTITSAAIDERGVLAERTLSPNMGAVVSFAGVVREKENGASIDGLEYEAFEPMARHQVDLLFQELERRWPIESVRLIHRVGRVPVNETALWVEIVAAHRGDAFAASQWLINELKRVVPIWKRPLPWLPDSSARSSS